MRTLFALSIVIAIAACPASAPKHGVELHLAPAKAGSPLEPVVAILQKRLAGIDTKGLEIQLAAPDLIKIKVPGGVHLDEIKKISLTGGRLELLPVDDAGTALLAPYMLAAPAEPAEDEAPEAAQEGAAALALPPGVTVKQEREGYYVLESGRRKALEEAFAILAPKLPEARRFMVTEKRDARLGESPWQSLLVDTRGWEASAHLQGASVQRDQVSATPSVSLAFDVAGAKALLELTQALVGKRLAIVLDGEIDSIPLLQAPISGGRLQIAVAGDTTREQLLEAEAFVAALRGGALPVAMLLSVQKPYGETKSIGAGGM